MKRDTAHRRGYDKRWQKIRAMHLAANPLCAECQNLGRVVPATVVDHIVPHRGNWELFNDPTNHQSLCASCHSRKTAREDGGFGNKGGGVGSGCDVSGKPTDPRHHWNR